MVTLVSPRGPEMRRIDGVSAPSASTYMLASAYKSVIWNAAKSIGSGALDQHPPNTSGQRSCSHSDDHPPEECPVNSRPSGRGASLYFDSR